MGIHLHHTETRNLKSTMDSSDYDSDIFEVERILGHTKKMGVWYYKVRWQGYGSEEDTLEPEANLHTCQDIVDHYWEEKQNILQPKTGQPKKINNEDGSDFESSVDLDPQPGKRKRGRPPKKKKFLDARRQKDINSNTSDDEEIPVIVKRRPGRPRKHEADKAFVSDLDSSVDTDSAAVRHRRGRPPKTKPTERKREQSLSSREQVTESNSSEEEEDIPWKLKRKAAKPKKVDSGLDKELLALSSPEFSCLFELDDIEPRGMTRLASKEMALVQLRKEYVHTAPVAQDTRSAASGERKDDRKGSRDTLYLGDEEGTSQETDDALEQLSSLSAEIIEISSQSTEDCEGRRDYIFISSQSESEFEEGTGQGSKVKPRGDQGEGEDLELSEDDERSKKGQLGSNEDGSRTNEIESQVTTNAREKTEKNKEGDGLFYRLTTSGESGKITDDTVENTRTSECFPGLGAQGYGNRSRDFDCNSGGDKSSTKDNSRLNNVVLVKSADDSVVRKEGNEVSTAKSKDDNSNKLSKHKLSKLFAVLQRSRSPLPSKESIKVDAVTENSESLRGSHSGSPNISEETDNVSNGTKSGGKPAQVRGLFDRFDTTRRKSVGNAVDNLGSEQCINSARSEEDKTGVCKDAQRNLGPLGNKKESEKGIINAKTTRKKTLSGEDIEVFYGNKGDVVAKQPHSRSNGSVVLATELNVSETVEERLRTSPRGRVACRSRSTGALMEGDLLGSIIQGGIQGDGKKVSHGKLSVNVITKKGDTTTEETPSLESMMEDISDEELDISEFEFDLDDFSPENFYDNTEVKPRAKRSPSPVVTPLDVPFGTLKQAIKQGDEMTLRHALAGGCDVDKVDNASGMSLLMWAAAAGQDNIVCLLLRNGAKGNMAQRNGITALLHASEQGFAETVEILLDSGAHINAQQMTGETALMKAAKKGHADVVDILLRKAADTRVQSNFDHSALQLALRSQHFEIHNMISEHEKRLTSILEVALGKCIGRAGSLRTPPLMPFRCIAPGEDEKVLLQFKYLPSRFPQGADVVLFCVRAEFYVEDVYMSFSGDNGVRSIVLNGKVQLPVLQGNRSVYVLKPEPENNELCVHTHVTSSRLIVCIYPVSG